MFGMYTLIGAALMIGLLASPLRAGEDIPVAARFILVKAGQLSDGGDTEAAIELLKNFQMKAGDPEDKATIRKGYLHNAVDFALGNCYLKLSQYDRAVECYQTAVKKNPGLADGWINLARCCYELGRNGDAANAFVKGYDAGEKKEPVYLYYSSVCRLAQGDADQAYALFMQLLNAHPDDIEPTWKESLVQILFALEKYAEALPYIETLAETSTGAKKKEWQNVLLSQYIMLGMDERAALYAEKLIEEDPLESRWWKALCHIHLSKDRFKEGLCALILYSFLTPLTDEEKGLIGDLCMMLEIPEKAVSHYESIAGVDKSGETIKKLYRAHMGLHDAASALAWIEKGLAQNDDPDLLMAKGNILYENARFDEAAAVYEKITTQKEADGQAFLMLGYALWNIGDLTGAEKAFVKAGDYSKERKPARKALAQLSRANANS